VKNKTDTTNAGLTTENQLNIHKELKRLRKENASLKEDREILKKAVS
jgi:transposase-like protein